MAEGSGGGATGILGVLIGAALVAVIGFFFLQGGMGGSKSVTIDVKPPAVAKPG